MDYTIKQRNLKLADNAFDRNLISEKLFEALGSVVGVQSISLVGSFCDKQDLSVISDIDTIVVCDNLTEEIFESCIDSVSCLSGSELGFPDREIFVNSSFGPLKFDKPNLIVIHLMIYDTAGHREHVLKSPFTCYDWERTKASYGLNLKDIYPVKKIFSSDLFLRNRGLNLYKKNLISKSINYQKYIIKNNKMITQKLNYKISGKDVLEFWFNVIKL